MNPIVLEGLTVRYGDRLALDDVSLAVPEGAVYAVLGRNGAGKSSLVRCLLGEQRPAAGRVSLLGRDVWTQRAAILEDVGVVPEDPDMPPAMSSWRIARFCSRLYPRWDAAGVEARLKRFGVPAEIPCGRLSKGQRAQVALALALASTPRLLVLDDPTLGLDAVARKAVFEELIGELADRGTTVFITSHDLAGVERIADRVAVLRQGRLVLDEEMDALKHRFRRLSFPAALTPPTPSLPASLPSAGREEARREWDRLEALAPVAVASRGWGIEAVVAQYDEERLGSPEEGGPEVSALTLEEIFIALTGEEAGR
ncbi:MAG TPA: ABC transporter ATP-binding protein [Thermoanaerobaculia bacterium]|jgi:ABC-2 type transport system ATP-binding protein|nr:ABC transporter ATP-binding protein [Thermoanaerobaculia bacterium]